MERMNLHVHGPGCRLFTSFRPKDLVDAGGLVYSLSKLYDFNSHGEVLQVHLPNLFIVYFTYRRFAT